MGVDVDEAGRHHLAAGVDLLRAGAGHPAPRTAANGRDGPVLHRHVGLEGRGAGSVDDAAAPDHHVVGLFHGRLLQERRGISVGPGHFAARAARRARKEKPQTLSRLA